MNRIFEHNKAAFHDPFRVKKDKHGDLVGEIEDRVLTPTAYSPSALALSTR